MTETDIDQTPKPVRRTLGGLLRTVLRPFRFLWREGRASAPLVLVEPPQGWPILRLSQPEDNGASPEGAPPEDFMARRAAKAALRTSIIEAFDAAHPIERRDNLTERHDKLNQLFDSVLDGHQHAIIHGRRGSGKTSLTRVFGDYADQHGAVVLYLACEPTNDFAALLAPYLQEIPRSALRPGATLSRESYDSGSPRALAGRLAESVSTPLIFVFDEFDRITDRTLQSDVATTMKLLSDVRAPVQFILVGIAQSVDGLIAGHLSLRRHLIAIEVGLLSESGVRDIIDRGSQLCGVPFEDGARAIITQASFGSPYHVQLFCQSAGLEMVRRDEARVTTDIARDGLALATEAWGRLNRADHAVFERICGADRTLRATVLELATIAIRDGGIDMAQLAPEFRDGIDSLAGAISAEAGDSAQIVFHDSLAPQFLRAMLILSDDHDTANTSTGVPGRLPGPASAQAESLG